MTSAATPEVTPPPSAWSVVHLAGDLDMAAIPDLRQLLRRVTADPLREVVVDLSDVTFMDCSALGLLMDARARLGSRLWLRGVPPSVQWLLQLANLQAAFPVLAEPALHAVPADTNDDGETDLRPTQSHLAREFRSIEA